MAQPRNWALPAALAAAILAACNGANGDLETGGKSATVGQALEKLEASGALPVLDRSSSIAGGDANADGLRDDIAQHIDRRPDTGLQKNSLKSFSRALTSAMTVDINDPNALRAVANHINTAVSCIWKNYPENSASSLVREIEKLTVNTRSRYDAYMRFNAAMNGSVIKNETEVNCD